MDFTIERGVAKSPKGIPKSPRWFIDNRVSFSYDSLGVVQVLYYQNRRVTFTPTIFLRKLRGGFRCYLNDNGVMYNPTYENVRVWPFGMESDFNHKGHKMTFEVLALDDSIVFRLIAPETLPEGMSLRMEFFHEFSLKCDNSDYRYSDNGYPRHWRYWTLDEAGDCLIGGYETDPTRADEKKTSGAASVDPVPEQMRDYEDYRVTLDNETPLPYEDSYGVGVCIAADFPYTFAQKSDGSDYLAARGKQILNGALRPGAAHSYVISFAEDAGGARLKARALAGRVNERIAAQFDRYGKVIENAPVLKSPYQGLNDYVAMAPLYHEALRMTERPGALRAKQDYFCWAWDTMTNSRSSLYWGDLRRVGDMLAFFHDASDPQKGLPHGFSYDFTPTYYYPLPAQGFYICILHQYIVFGGERERAEKYYPFARTLYLRMLTSEAGQTGLGSGLSLFPDFTRYMGENGHDLSSMNNTLLYCSSRAMEYLALYFGDRKTADTARAFFLRTEENYLKLFLDPDKNMVVSSVDSRDYKRRDCFSAGSVKWENNYLYDLLGPVMNGCLEVYKNGMVCEAGLREVAWWNPAFDGDCNQMHCWWPVVCEYYLRAVNRSDDRELVDKYAGWLAYWVSNLTIPEAIPCYADTAEPELDRWNSLLGSWYSFTIRAWYDDVIHSVFGVDIDAGGMTFYPYGGAEMSLSGLHWGDRVFDIEMKGSGPFAAELIVNGVRLRGTHKLPTDVIRPGRNEITVVRGGGPAGGLCLLCGTGVELSRFANEGGVLSARLSGLGTGRLHIYAESRPTVTLDGKPAEARYDAKSRLAVIESVFEPEAALALSIGLER